METLIEIDCSAYSENIIDIFFVFQKIGWWIYNPQKKVEYLPIADNDNYDWQCEKMLEVDFYNIINNKINNKELVGVNLFYNNSDVGVSLLAYNTNQITLGISINRKTIDKRHTDMIWYLENIIYKLFEADVRLLSYRFEEFED